MTQQVLESIGKLTSTLKVWSSTAWQKGDFVVHLNAIWKANANIPAGTPFAMGLSGRTWTRMVDGYDTQPVIQLPWAGTIFSRVHAYGSQIFRAGGSITTRIGAFGLDSGVASSYELPVEDGPARWLKIGATTSNFFGLGDDGVLYIAGGDSVGQLGDGPGNSERGFARANTNPALYGPGIQVVDFWSTEADTDANANQNNCIALVLDNGTYKTYGWGYNTNGQLGIGSTTNQSSPVEIVPLRGRRIIALSSWESLTMMVTDNGQVWGAGYNWHGTLGIGNEVSPISTISQAKESNTQVVTNAVDIKIAWRAGIGITAFVLKADGTVWAAGTGDSGILGDGNTAVHERNFFQPVLTYPGAVPLTGIVKIVPQYSTFMALSSEGRVYACGHNWDGNWGDGTSPSDNYPWARVVQSNMKDVWTTNAEDGNLASFFLDNNNILWAAGANSDYQLGTATSGTSVVSFRQRVALPPGEYPVQLVKTGAVTGAAYLGTTCLTNKNRLYIWGATGADLLPQMGMGLARLPVLINDFYQPNQA
jgi:alpha-tubulin suppressor-like RCC1 family protein